MTSYSGGAAPSGANLPRAGLPRRGAGLRVAIAVAGLILASMSFWLLTPGLARAATPTVSVSPTSGTPGTGLAVSGSGWPAGDEVFVQIGSATFDNDVVCVLVADSTGKISGTDAANGCAVPNVPNGTQPLVAIDAQNQGVVAHSSFVVKAGLVLTPANSSAGAPASPGTSISAVGHGFAASATVSGFRFDTAALATTPASISTDANGNTTSPVTFTVPASATAGTHNVSAHDSHGHTATQTLRIFVVKVSVSPTSGTPGTGLAVSGSGWPAGDEVFVQIGSATFDNDVVCVLVADSTGKISGTDAANGCAVPNVPNGTQPLVAIDAQNQGVVAHSSFVVKAGLVLTPANSSAGAPASPGTSISAVGHGFAASATVSGFRFDTAALATTPASISTDANGNTTSPVTFTVPASATAGTHNVSAHDSHGHTATQTLRIFVVKVSVSPTSGTPGTGLAVSGSGWPAGDEVFVQIGSATFDNDVVCVLVADSTGKISGTDAANGCAVPNVPNGTQPLVAIDAQNQGVVAHSSFVVKAGLVLTPANSSAGAPASPGTSISAVGHGFAASATVSGFRFDTAALATTPASISTDANGNTTSPVTFTVPASATAGTHNVSAHDSHGHTATQTLRIFVVKVSVSPTSGTPGTGLAVSGSGWPAGDEVFVQIGSATFDNDVVCVLVADSTGKISGTDAANGCAVPNVPNGTQPLVAIDAQNQGVVAHSTFHVT